MIYFLSNLFNEYQIQTQENRHVPQEIMQKQARRNTKGHQKRQSTTRKLQIDNKPTVWVRTA
jgi:hypothetical protein